MAHGIFGLKLGPAGAKSPIKVRRCLCKRRLVSRALRARLPEEVHDRNPRLRRLESALSPKTLGFTGFGYFQVQTRRAVA